MYMVLALLELVLDMYLPSSWMIPHLLAFTQSWFVEVRLFALEANAAFGNALVQPPSQIWLRTRHGRGSLSGGLHRVLKSTHASEVYGGRQCTHVQPLSQSWIGTYTAS
jgi:hypothetical protein